MFKTLWKRKAQFAALTGVMLVAQCCCCIGPIPIRVQQSLLSAKVENFQPVSQDQNCEANAKAAVLTVSQVQSDSNFRLEDTEICQQVSSLR
jgi:hypothetical protein